MNSRINHERQGFSLTELSVVLGVIGVIIGGIWDVANTTRRSAKVTQSANMVGQVVTSVRAYYSGFASIATDATLAAFTATLSDLKTTPFPSTVCAWTYGTNTNCTTPAASGASQNLAIEFTPPDLASCISLAVKLTSVFPVSGLKDVYINRCSATVGKTGAACATAATAATTGIPATVAFATAQCTAASTIDFVYTLRTPTGY